MMDAAAVDDDDDDDDDERGAVGGMIGRSTGRNEPQCRLVHHKSHMM
jgi:hypothetical protein